MSNATLTEFPADSAADEWMNEVSSGLGLTFDPSTASKLRAAFKAGARWAIYSRPQPEGAKAADGVVVPREVAEQSIRALRRDMNFGYEMANNWYQKGPFSSVDKGNAAQDFAKRCEEHIAALSHALSAGAK